MTNISLYLESEKKEQTLGLNEIRREIYLMFKNKQGERTLVFNA